MSDSVFLKRTIVKETLWSKHLQEERKLRIYLPPGYNEVLSYPVVYCQDGEEFFNFGRIATLAGRLIIEEDVEPFIIVGVEVNVAVRTQEYAPFGSRFKQYLSCFSEEIIPFIEQKYPVRRTPDERILAGDSLGAVYRSTLHLLILRSSHVSSAFPVHSILNPATCWLKKRISPGSTLIWSLVCRKQTTKRILAFMILFR